MLSSARVRPSFPVAPRWLQLGRAPDRFDFAWWDHVYNKAASNIVIDADSDDDEIKCRTARPLARADIVTTRLPDKEDTAIAAKQAKQAKKAQNAAGSAPSNPLYSMFVRSTPLLPGQAGAGSDSDAEDDAVPGAASGAAAARGGAEACCGGPTSPTARNCSSRPRSAA